MVDGLYQYRLGNVGWAVSIYAMYMLDWAVSI